MLQTNKNSYRVIVVCRNGEKEGRYTFIEDYDETWETIACQMFYDEYGVNPTEMKIESREKL